MIFASAPTWISAPTSGILHVAGEGYPRRECKDGIRLLCGWVIHSSSAPIDPRKRDETKIGMKCRACLQWIRLHS